MKNIGIIIKTFDDIDAYVTTVPWCAEAWIIFKTEHIVK